MNPNTALYTNGHFFFHWLYSPLGPWPLIFSFMIILRTVGLLGRVISSSQGFYLNTGQHKHRINTYTHQTSMHCVGFEPTITASERAKTVHGLDRSATVTGIPMEARRNSWVLTLRRPHGRLWCWKWGERAWNSTAFFWNSGHSWSASLRRLWAP
jgi:hypothetical protein